MEKLECIIVHGSMLSVSSLSSLACHSNDVYYFTDARDDEIVHKRGGLLQTFQNAVAEQ